MQRINLTRVERRRPGLPAWLWAALALGVLLSLLVIWACSRRPAPRPVPKPPPAASRPPVVYPWAALRPPTARALAPVGDLSGVIQPTASGRIESGTYGSVRTAENGGRVMSRFHEGIDIAPATKGRNGRPLDVVCAIAPGTVAYVNSVAGNSSYGKYVVLLHRDPIGDVYSLYAHLAQVQDGLRGGAVVAAGDPLGIMGNTSSMGIAAALAHVHLEIGLISNQRFAEWYRAQKLVPDHGTYNGQNFFGIDPLGFFALRQADPKMHFARFLSTVPAAFEIVVRTRQPIDFFQRHAALWEGPPAGGMATRIVCSENGLPLHGRVATDAESAGLRGGRCHVLTVDEQALGRNGCHLVSRSSGEWNLTSSGFRWLEILCYGSGLLGSTEAPARPPAGDGRTGRERVRRR